MGNVHFFPRLTEELVEKSGYKASEYELSYVSPTGDESRITLSKGRVRTASDPAEVWRLRKDGLVLEKTVIVEYPEELKGPNGVVPAGARILPCILWSNQRLTSAGVITPDELRESSRLACRFKHKFEPGSLAGDLTLEMVLYVCAPAPSLEPEEDILMNEPGVLLGSLERPVTIDFDGASMDFPIEEFEDLAGPLWRMQFEPWYDPREDLFSAASFVLLLNAKHPDCPKIVGGKVSNQALLQEILCEAYFLIFERVRGFHDDSAWDDMISDSNLAPESICSILHWFSQRGEEPFDWSTPEGRMLSIKKIVDQSFVEDAGDE